MGKTRTPIYQLRIYDNQESPNAYHIQAWNGQATDKRLLAYLVAHVKSLCPAGANYHISDRLGFIPYPHKAQIVRNQSPFAVVVEWTAETFQVW